MRIAYLVSQYPAINHTYILSEILGLRDQGIEVNTISISPPDRPLSELSDIERAEAKQTFYVKRCGGARTAGALLRTFFAFPATFFRNLFFAVQLSRLCPVETARWLLFFVQAVLVGDYMRRSGLKHVHVHYSSSVGLLVGRIFPLTVSHTIHGSGEFENAALFHMSEKVQNARFICAISRYGKSQIMRLSRPEHWDRIYVCPLGVDPERFAPKQGGHKRDEPIELLTVGQLAPAKGMHVLIAAVALLRTRGRDIRLRIIGDGPLRQSLARYAESIGVGRQVVFEGFCNNAALYRFYAHADIFVMASFAEGIPVVLMEAMAMELPCVSTRITGIPELIEDGKTGLLVSPADEAALAEAVERLIEDESLRRELGRAARERIVRDYHIARNTARLAEIFRSHLNEGELGRSVPY